LNQHTSQVTGNWMFLQFVWRTHILAIGVWWQTLATYSAPGIC